MIDERHEKRIQNTWKKILDREIMEENTWKRLMEIEYLKEILERDTWKRIFEKDEMTYESHE